MRISDWSSDVCSSDLIALFLIGRVTQTLAFAAGLRHPHLKSANGAVTADQRDMSEPDAGPCNCRPRLLRLCGVGEQHLVEAHVVQGIDRASAHCRKLIVDLEPLMLRIADRETADGSVEYGGDSKSDVDGQS